MNTLGIKTVTLKKDKVVLSLDVDDSIKQPFGAVHGGINAVLAESAANTAANLNVPEGTHAVGVSLNTTHLKSVTQGTLLAEATPVHIGRMLQTWNIKITNGDRLTSVSELTMYQVNTR